MRVDKWLWAVRLFKTRSQATSGCKAGFVIIEGRRAKPSSEVRVGNVIQVTRGELKRTLKVVALLEKRIGAKLVPDYMEDQTPKEEWDKLIKPKREGLRVKGAGRPTKKDRREMKKFFG